MVKTTNNHQHIATRIERRISYLSSVCQPKAARMASSCTFWWQKWSGNLLRSLVPNVVIVAFQRHLPSPRQLFLLCCFMKPSKRRNDKKNRRKHRITHLILLFSSHRISSFASSLEEPWAKNCWRKVSEQTVVENIQLMCQNIVGWYEA